MAEKSSFDRLINPNDNAFFATESMIETIRSNLKEKDLPISDVLKCVYLSLATSYDSAIKTIEKYADKKIESIIIVGGGSKDKYLNELASKITGKKVLTGLSEGTALGNILSQIMVINNISLPKGRELIKNSFEFKVFQ